MGGFGSLFVYTFAVFVKPLSAEFGWTREQISRLLDRFFGARVAFAVNSIAAVGLLLLARANNLAAGCLAAALMGIAVGGEAAITPYLLTRYSGVRGFSTLYRLTWTFYAAAGAIGPVILGRSFDLTGSYASLLTILSISLALAGMILLSLPRYEVEDRRPQPA
jgi:hypothetical protein